MAFLKQLPVNKDMGGALQNLSAINVLIQLIMAVIKCVLQFSDLDPKYFEAEIQPSAMNEIARATYWTIYSVVTCSSYIAALGLRDEHTMAKMASQLRMLASKVSSMQKGLELEFSHWKSEIELYKGLNDRFNKYQDLTTILIDLFDVGPDGKPPLVLGTDAEIEVGISSLKDTKVFLLISGLDAWDEQINSLKALAKLYQELQAKEQNRYQIVWLPIVDKFNEQKFSKLQSLMPWYTVRNPKIIKTYFIKYIREVWKFTNETILVPLDQKSGAKFPTSFTLYSVCISGKLAELFTQHEIIPPWDQSLQRALDLLLGGIYTGPSPKKASIICLFGGEDVKWIGDFITEINVVKDNTQISIDLVYVGRSSAIDHSKAILDSSTEKKLSDCSKADEIESWLFWTRLERIFCLGIGDSKNAKENNTMKDVKTLLSFKGSYMRWAAFTQSGSSNKMAKAAGEVVLEVLSKINEWWKADTNVDSFVLALNEKIEELLKDQKHHCYHIVLPTVAKVADEMMICEICDRKMVKYLMYRCCE
ncbi:hypothetical protein GH714_027100 [Hevea brasiliensis]|uniref:Sieve element occlusion C-terminal domain-containing protein n=1 Tax=Hevea brasiliensis TaxID=3981 RepID=A0A6A6L0U3_HEVBR|nr:hypothetical protein GH714_027100 [Hevea brasiliensis]